MTEEVYIKKSDALAACQQSLDELMCVDSPCALAETHRIKQRIEWLAGEDVTSVKRGRWIDHIEEDYIGNGEYGYIVLPKCSVCGSLNSKKCHYCPNCGARLEVDG